MKSRSRTTIEPEVRWAIEGEARADLKATSRQIRGRVQRTLRLQGLDKPLPKDRAIQGIAKRARALPGPSSDDPWSLGVSPPDIPPEATADLLAVKKLTYSEEELFTSFTIRQAKWVARLRSALPDAHPEFLLKWAMLYGVRERTAQERKRPMDTADLDAELSFQPWKSALHAWEYDQAVITGAVKTPTLAIMRLGVPFLYFLGYGRGFLREVGGEQIDQRSWWPHAESVMAYWLREISDKVKRWTGINMGSGGGLPGAQERQDWDDMGRHLAALVIEEAKALERYDSNRTVRDKHMARARELDRQRAALMMSGRYGEEEAALDAERDKLAAWGLEHLPKGYWETWKPVELLKAVGYED